MKAPDLVISAASRHGLVFRGGFSVDASSEVPDLGEGVAAKSLLLFGNAGSAMWEVFKDSAEYHDRRPDPLNRWSARIGRGLAERFSARAVFPFDRPHPPFLRWAKKAERLQNSHLGMLIHPQFGLWHAYRFALIFAQTMELPATTTATAAEGICRRCAPRPCRGACPVGAFSDEGYDAHACHGYLQAHPDCPCMTEGCQARSACPEGAGHRYQPPHAAFHLRAFVVAMAKDEFAGAGGGGAAKRASGDDNSLA